MLFRSAPDEAKRLHAASRKQINDIRLLKKQLMEELSSWISAHHLKQTEAAEILMVSRPRISDVVNKKTAKFTIDALVEMLSRVGKPVKLAIGCAPRQLASFTNTLNGEAPQFSLYYSKTGLPEETEKLQGHASLTMSRKLLGAGG